MKKLSNSIYFGITLVFFSFLDFHFSNLISQKLAHGWHSVGPIFKIVYVENTGAAFSILQNSTTFLIILSILAIVGIFYFVVKNIETLYMRELLFVSFLTAGILGNLSERLFLGFVRDFFDLTFVNFPIFNISDIFINVGVLGIIILLLSTKKQIKLL